MRVDDWFLTAAERGNPATLLDRRRPDGLAWAVGNLVRPLVHGATYFAELLARVGAMESGDLVLFTDWRGDPDERLSPDGPTVGELFCAAARRGVIVRGLVWRSHLDRFQFSQQENRHLGEEIDAAGGQCLLDMRVRPGGSHHVKMIVLRHRDRPWLDVAFVGGIDLCHSRRDDATHAGDPQRQPMARVFGSRPPWHDVQAMIRGPAVGDAEAVFRERWQDSAPVTRNPVAKLHDLLDRQDDRARPLPPQLPDPPSCGQHAVQLLRTYAYRRRGYSFAPEGERSIARGYLKVLPRARSLIYLEDQYLWSATVVSALAGALARQPELRLIVILPLFPDQDGRLSMPPNLVGRIDALRELRRAAGDRVAVYGLENEAGTPIYVHAKVCVVDDAWTIIGSDNFNRRSWTHDSELSCAVIDLSGDPAAAAHGAAVRDTAVQGGAVQGTAVQDGAVRNTAVQDAEVEEAAAPGGGCGNFARALRLELSNEHLGAKLDPETDAATVFEAFRQAAAELDRWHEGGQAGPRPPGQLRGYRVPELGWWQRVLARPLYHLVYDPDGRPARMRRRGLF